MTAYFRCIVEQTRFVTDQSIYGGLFFKYTFAYYIKVKLNLRLNNILVHIMEHLAL